MNRALYYMADGRLRPIWRFVVSILLFFAASFVAFGVARLVMGRDRELMAVVSRPLLMILVLLAFTWMLRVFDRVPRQQAAAMGLPGGRLALWDSLFGVLLGSAMVALTIATIAWKGDLQVSGDVHGIKTGTLLVEVLLVLSTAAMVEELVFRGYPFQRLVESTGPGGAIALMSALFGAVHLRNPNSSTLGLLNTMLIGIVFSVAYLRARTLWLPWGIHWAWNAVLGAGIGLPVSGLDLSIGIRGKASGPVWLTGGGYGPEASVACTVAVMAGLVVVLLAFHRRPALPGVEDGTGSQGTKPA
ncbi:MAG TPA: type II CAAX endopeptidase family protein [Terriglobales bacterium]|nr:type II CAAX endopeptidase family protein [Terriglobales bacterium]